MYTRPEILYTIFRPRVSEIGAAIIGPIPKPRTKRERERIETVRETENCWAISGVEGVMRDEPAVTAKLRKAMGKMCRHRFSKLQLCGFSGSSGPFQSWAVMGCEAGLVSWCEVSFVVFSRSA